MFSGPWKSQAFLDKDSSAQLKKSLKAMWPEAESINLNG